MSILLDAKLIGMGICTAPLEQRGAIKTYTRLLMDKQVSAVRDTKCFARRLIFVKDLQRTAAAVLLAQSGNAVFAVHFGHAFVCEYHLIDMIATDCRRLDSIKTCLRRYCPHTWLPMAIEPCHVTAYVV